MKTVLKLTALTAALACAIATQAGFAQPQPAPQTQAGGAVTERRPVAAFHAIELDGPYHVVVEAGGQPALFLSGERKDLDEIETLVHGDTLVVRPRGHIGFHFSFSKWHEPPTVRITASGLTSLRMSGSGDVDLNRLGGNAFTLENSGPGDLRANGAVRQLNVTSSGSGDLDLGQLQAADVKVSMQGPGDVHLAALTGTLSAQVEGSGDLSADGLHAAKVEAWLRGPGDVRLAGSSRELRLEASGSGDFNGCDLAVESAHSVQRGPGNACIGGTLRAFEAEVSGSGDLNVHGLQSAAARLRMNGPGNVQLAGTVGQLDAEVNGSGDLDARHLDARHADVQVRGPGSATVNVLDGGANGGGTAPAGQAGRGQLLLVDRRGSHTRR